MAHIFDNLGLIAGIFGLLLAIVFWRAMLWLFGVIIVSDDSLGSVTKKFVIFGANSKLTGSPRNAGPGSQESWG